MTRSHQKNATYMQSAIWIAAIVSLNRLILRQKLYRHHNRPLPNGERSTEKAPTCRACEARPPRLRGVARTWRGAHASRRSTVAFSVPKAALLEPGGICAPDQCSEFLA